MAIIAENRKARHEYEVLETFEAGLALTGQEVKSIKTGRIQLAGSYVSARGEELFLLGAHIPPYQPQNAPADYEPQRERKLLLHKDEISYLIGKIKEKGLTFIPLRVYNRKGKIKLELALARGKRKADKRETIKKREAQREMKRAFKHDSSRG